MKKPRYKKKELVRIAALYMAGKSDAEIAEEIGRTEIGVRVQRQMMGLMRPDAVELSEGHKWTEADEEFIRNNWREFSDAWMAKKLGVTKAAYKHKRMRLGYIKEWKREKGRLETWTEAEIRFLRTYYPNHSSDDIAKYMPHNAMAIQSKASRMGIKKAYQAGRRGYPPLAEIIDR